MDYREWAGMSSEPIKKIGGTGLREKLARLYFIRKQNRDARLSPGLGALNVPFARQFGGQSLAAQIGSDDVQSARAMAAVERLNREIDQIDQRLDREEMATKQLRAQVGGGLRSSREQRKQGLLARGNRAVNKAGMSRLMPMLLGKGGHQLLKGYLKTPVGKVHAATMIIQGVGLMMNEAADGIEAINALKKQGATTGEIARKTYQSAQRRVIETVTSPFHGIAKGVMRMSGKTGEEADKSLADFFERMSTTREERARKSAMIQDLVDKATAAERAKHEREWEKLTHTPPQGFQLAGRREANMYRRDILKMNRQRWEQNRARDEKKAREEVMAAAQGGV